MLVVAPRSLKVPSQACCSASSKVRGRRTLGAKGTSIRAVWTALDSRALYLDQTSRQS